MLRRDRRRLHRRPLLRHTGRIPAHPRPRHPAPVRRERNRRLLPRTRPRECSRLCQLPRCRRLLALPARRHRLAHLARRMVHRLHALSAGDLAGHAAGHLRIPDHDLRAHRHGRRQRLDVRRLHRLRRGADDGRARHRTPQVDHRQHAFIPSIARSSPPTRATRECRSPMSATAKTAASISKRSTRPSTTTPPACSSSRQTSSA